MDTVSYEGEGPIRLEGLAFEAYDGRALPASVSCSDWDISVEQDPESLFRLDCRAMLCSLAETRRSGAKNSESTAASLALEFHKAIAAASLEGARRMREQTGLTEIALSGGVFQNVLLCELLIPALTEEGFEVYTHRDVPAGDGGIAVGQVYFLPGNG